MATAWDGQLSGTLLSLHRVGLTIDVTAWVLDASPALGVEECAYFYIGPLPPGVYTINFFLQHIINDPVPVLKATQSLVVTDAGVPPLYAYTFTGDALPVEVSFFDQPPGTASSPQTITVVNTESVPRWLSIQDDLCGGGGDASLGSCVYQSTDFPYSTNCPQVLAPGATCPISVSFIPSGSGPRHRALYIGSFVSDGGGGTVGGTLGISRIAISGDGVVMPIPVLSPPMLLLLIGGIVLIAGAFIGRRSF